jgi:hypothetical protein
LVELVNLFDPAISFEPIHRLLIGTETASVLQTLERLPGYSRNAVTNSQDSESKLQALVQDQQCGKLRLGIAAGEQYFLIEANPVPLAVDVLQPLLDEMINTHNRKASIDYIHGGNELFRLSGGKNPSVPGSTGILLPPFRKQGLFETIAKHGPLPRKSFSMGESGEKRYYLECRRLF